MNGFKKVVLFSKVIFCLLAQRTFDTETPITTGKIVSNTKTILKLEAKISERLS